MSSKKGKRLLRPIADGNYQKRRDEHQLCLTPGCRNVIAVWAKRSYCTRCRKAR